MRFAVSSPFSSSNSILETIAGLFHPPEQIDGISQLGSGNVNDTFLVTLNRSASRSAFVMQRLNTEVFEQPELVMRNLLKLGLSLIHISSPRDRTRSRMPSSA